MKPDVPAEFISSDFSSVAVPPPDVGKPLYDIIVKSAALKTMSCCYVPTSKTTIYFPLGLIVTFFAL